MRVSRLRRVAAAAAAALPAAWAVLGPAAHALAEAPASRETTAERHWWLPANTSTFGPEVDKLFYAILWLTTVVCIAVFAVLVIFLVKYRHRAGRHALFTHGNPRLEAVWTIIPTVILALTAILSQTSWAKIKYTRSMPGEASQPVEMEVVAQQFQWNFHYAGKDGKLGARKAELMTPSGDPASQIGLDTTGDGADDFVTQVMTVPVNRKVYIHLASKDVIHSFFLPTFRIKQDALPGIEGRVWFEATQTSAEAVGTFAGGAPKPYDIACAELCGQGHFKMRGMLYVVSEDEYKKFLDDENAKIAPPAAEGASGSGEKSGGDDSY